MGFRLFGLTSVALLLGGLGFVGVRVQGLDFRLLGFRVGLNLSKGLGVLAGGLSGFRGFRVFGFRVAG